MKNRKGFTIIELLAVITVLGLLIAIALPAINKELAKFRLKYYKQVENTVKVAGQEYVEDKRFSRPTKLLYSKVVKVNELVDKNYMEQIKDYNKKACDNDDTSYSYFVMVKAGDKKYEYQACIKCSEDEYYTDTSDTELDLCNPAWLTNNYISYNGLASDDSILWVYYGSSEQEIERQVGIKYGIVKRDSKGNVVAQIDDPTVGNKVIYPDNINELVSANLDQVITLRYTLPNGDVITKKAKMYRYSSPKITMTYGVANSYSNKAVGATYANGNDEWANTINIKVEYADADKTKYSELISEHGIDHLEYYKDSEKKWMPVTSCNSASGSSCTWAYSDNFNGNIKFRLVDGNQNKTRETSFFKVNVDKTAPTSNLAITSGTKDSTNSVYVSDVVLTLTKGDSLSGVGKYGIDTTENYNSKDTLTINTDVNNTYYGYVVDKAGNKKTSTGVNVKRDKIYVITLNNAGANKTAGSASANATYGNTTLSTITIPEKTVTAKFSVASGITASSTTDITKAYTFNGWFTAKSGGAKIAGNTTSPALEASTNYTDANKKWNKVVADNSVTLYAHWTHPSITLPTITKTGNDCIWTSPKSGGGEYTWNSGGTYNPADVDGAITRTFTASCSAKTYTISYVYNSGTAPSSGVPSSYTFGVGATVNGKPTRTGYKFNGWSANSNLSSPAFTKTISKADTGNKTFYAKWCQNCASISNGECTLNANTAGTCSYTSKCNAGYRISAGNGTRSHTCTICDKNTYSAGGTSTTCSSCPAGYSTSGTGSTSKEDCTITCNANTRVTAANGKCTGSCSTGYTIGKHTVKAGKTSPACSPRTYTLTYDNQSGSGCSTKTGTYDSAWGDLCTPTRTGYTFGGWYTGTNGTGTKVTKNTIVKGNLTVYAKWTAKTYTVTLDRDGGSGGSGSVTATYGSAMPSANAPSKSGYQFKGYYTQKSGKGTKYYNADMTSARSYNLTSNTTLYAYWTSAVPGYRVKFEGRYYVWRRGSNCTAFSSCNMNNCDTIGAMNTEVYVTDVILGTYNSSKKTYENSRIYGYAQLKTNTPFYSIGAGFKTAVGAPDYPTFPSYWCSDVAAIYENQTVSYGGYKYTQVQWHDTSEGPSPSQFFDLVKAYCNTEVNCKCPTAGQTYDIAAKKCK